jgi:hypothetical protein
VSIKRIEAEIVTMRPKAVVIGDGVWFIWSGRRDFKGYYAILKSHLRQLVAMANKVSNKHVE